MFSLNSIVMQQRVVLAGILEGKYKLTDGGQQRAQIFIQKDLK